MKNLFLSFGFCILAFSSRSFGETKVQGNNSPIFVDEKVQKENLEILKQMREI